MRLFRQLTLLEEIPNTVFANYINRGLTLAKHLYPKEIECQYVQGKVIMDTDSIYHQERRCLSVNARLLDFVESHKMHPCDDFGVIERQALENKVFLCDHVLESILTTVQ